MKRTLGLNMFLFCVVILLVAGGPIFAQGNLKKVLVVDLWQQAAHLTQQTQGDSLIKQLGRQMGYTTVISKDGAQLNDADLATFQVVVFNNVCYNPLSAGQKTAFQKYVDNGGGFIGWHASDAIHGLWPWYIQFIGADITTHPALQNARIYAEVKNKEHPWYKTIMAGVSESYYQSDEWYNMSPDPAKDSTIIILQLVDEKTYTGGTMTYHAVTWCREYGAKKSRMYFNGIGHTNANYQNVNFKLQVTAALKWAAKDDGVPVETYRIQTSPATRPAEFPALARFGGAYSLNGRSLNQTRSQAVIIRTLDNGKYLTVLPLR